MSDQIEAVSSQQEVRYISVGDITTMMIRDAKLHEGLFELSVEFNIGAGVMGPSKDRMAPSAIVSVARIGLRRATSMGPITVDASVVNPRRSKTTKSRPR